MDKQYYGHANISISQQQGGGSKRVYFVHGSEWPIFRAQIWFFFGNRVWGRREWCKFYLFFFQITLLVWEFLLDFSCFKLS